MLTPFQLGLFAQSEDETLRDWNAEFFPFDNIQSPLYHYVVDERENLDEYPLPPVATRQFHRGFRSGLAMSPYGNLDNI